jgi:CubicO group peptidase (beta-lactamase class C family)
MLRFTDLSAAQSNPPTRDYFPTEGWLSATPAEQGMDIDSMDKMTDRVDTDLPFVLSIMVIRHGYVVYEEYFGGSNASTLLSVRSVTKSVMSAIVGIALENGDLPSLDITLEDALPDYFENGENADKSNITLRNLLMMRSGIDWGETQQQVVGLWQSRDDQIEYILSQSMADTPGAAWRYSTADAHLVSAMFQNLTGQSLLDYGTTHLFSPLGFGEVDWQEDSSGYNIGGAELYLTPRDMAKFGFLYLNNGLWDGQQIVPSDWVALTTTAQDEDVYYYGYQWWRAEHEFFGEHTAFVALGYGGASIFVHPELDLIVVTQSSYYENVETADAHERLMFDLISNDVIPAIVE